MSREETGRKGKKGGRREILNGVIRISRVWLDVRDDRRECMLL